MPFALLGARIFDGDRMLDGHAVVIDGERIVGLPPPKDLGAGLETVRVEGLLAPGFIDTQVNGGGGVLFNDERSAAGIRAIGTAHRAYGTTGFLPTFITDTQGRMREAFAAAADALREKIPGMPRHPPRRPLHQSGAQGRPRSLPHAADRGGGFRHSDVAHRRPHPRDGRARMDGGRGGREARGGRRDRQRGTHGGGSATIEEACRRGLRGFTHLFNAMPPLSGRDPGPVGAALDSRDTWCGLIVDGHHVSDAALRVAIAAKGSETMMLVTDAMSSVGSDLSTFDLMGRTVYRENGKLATADGTLAGSDLDMASAVRNAVERLNLPLTTALRMASRVPAAFLRLDHRLGRIAAGYQASLVLLDDALHVRRTWIDGSGD